MGPTTRSSKLTSGQTISIATTTNSTTNTTAAPINSTISAPSDTNSRTPIPITSPTPTTPTTPNPIISLHSPRSASTSTASSTSTIKPSHTFIYGLPKEFHNPKSLTTLIKNIPNLNTMISSLSFYRGGVAKVTSFDQTCPELLKQLSYQAGKPLRYETAKPSSPVQHQPPTPSFSCVIVGIDHDITEDEISAYLTERNISHRRVLRIIARLTNRPTRLIRIITQEARTLETLFTTGVTLYAHTYRVEPSNDQKANPSQCTKCHSYAHPTASCPEPSSVCGRCGGPHNITQCKPTESLKCCNCSGSHVAFSHSCPNRPKAPTSANTTAKLKYADVVKHSTTPETQPPTPPPPQEHTFIRFITTALLNLFPDRRPDVENILFPLIKQFYQLNTQPSYTGNYIHLTLVSTH